jgi:cytochrome b561
MSRYHPVLVVLHWLLAAMVIGGLVAGTFVLDATPNSDPFKMTSLKMHMSLGLAIGVLMLVRLATRLFTETPPHAATGNAMLDKLGVLTHWAFYVIVLAMVGSGLATANMADLPAIVFGGSGAPLPEDFSVFAPRKAHGTLAGLLILLVLLHVAAGLWHQYVRKDGLFSRMWFGRRDG